MRIHSEGKAIGCVVSRQVHAALKARADADSVSVAQCLAALLGAALEPVTATSGSDTAQELAASRCTIADMAAELTSLRGELEAARAEAQQWREASERTNDDVAALHRRIAEMQNAAPTEPLPVKIAQNGKLTEVLDYDLRRTASAYRSAGWSLKAIAREMQVPLASVEQALRKTS